MCASRRGSSSAATGHEAALEGRREKRCAAGRGKRGLVPWQAERWGVTIAGQPHHLARAARTMPGYMRSQIRKDVETRGHPRQTHRVHGRRTRNNI